MSNKLTKSFLISLLALNACAYDCEHRGLSFVNETNGKLHCPEVYAATECWASMLPQHELQVNEVLDRGLFVKWVDKLSLKNPKTGEVKYYNGLSYVDVGNILVRRSHDEVSRTAYFHELGHYLHQELYGHADAGHVNVEFWKLAESKAVAICAPSIKELMDKGL